MKKKYYKLILLINIILLIFVYFFFDIYYFIYISDKEQIFKYNNKISFKIKSYFSRYKYNYLDDFEKKYILRTSNTKEAQEKFLTNADSHQRPIVLLGCSYTYGQNLDKSNNFSGQLARYMKRPVYNLGLIGAGIQHMIYILRSKQIQSIINDPEYVIYTYIPDHTNRLYIGCGLSIIDYMYYRLNNNKLALNMGYSYIMRLPIPFILRILIYEKFTIPFNEKKELLEKHLLELYLQSKKNWKNSTFIIMVYDSSNEIEKITNRLREQGIKVIYMKEMLKEKNIVYDESFKLKKEVDKFQHPSEHAWDVIVPVLEEYIKEKKYDSINN